MKRSAFVLVLHSTALIMVPALGVRDSPAADETVRAMNAPTARETGTQTVADLVSLAEHGYALTSLMEMMQIELGKQDLPAAMRQCRRHPDFTSVHVLMLLRRQHPKEYARIAPTTKARILFSYLKRTRSAEDFSFMADKDAEEEFVFLPPKKKQITAPVSDGTPSKRSDRLHTSQDNEWRVSLRKPRPSSDQDAAQALLELPRALTFDSLLDLLEDNEEISWDTAPKSGVRTLERYIRRCDLAYRYMCILTGIKPEYSWSVDWRDKAIAGLLKQLGHKQTRSNDAPDYR